MVLLSLCVRFSVYCCSCSFIVAVIYADYDLLIIHLANWLCENPPRAGGNSDCGAGVEKVSTVKHIGSSAPLSFPCFSANSFTWTEFLARERTWRRECTPGQTLERGGEGNRSGPLRCPVPQQVV